jgi:hypothetical protein
MTPSLTTHPITPFNRDCSAWVSVDELCTAIEVEFGFRPCEKTVIRWRKLGCPHLPLSHRRIRYQVSEVIEWLLQSKVEGKARKAKRSLGRLLS